MTETIVVQSDEYVDYSSLRDIFTGEHNADSRAKDLYQLVVDSTRIATVESIDRKNNHLLQFRFITPIVDDFLRYHRDVEHLETDTANKFIMPIVTNNNAKNIQLALLYQQRKKKENTKAQLIISKIDTIQDIV